MASKVKPQSEPAQTERASEAPDGKRSYRSDRRTQQALETRRTIRAAAKELFAKRGYAATSIAAIADAAGVAPETIYATFKNKRTLLFEIEDTAVVGDDEPVALFEREFVEKAMAETDQRQRLRMLTKPGLEATARSGALAEIMRGAAASDPEVAAMWEDRKQARFQDTQRSIGLIAELGPLRLPLDEAVDLAFALTGQDVYTALVVDRGWSVERYVDAVTDIVERVGLGDPAS